MTSSGNGHFDANTPESGGRIRWWTAREAQEDWRKIGWRNRREVVGLARRGLVHPDPTVARVARRWAEATLENDTRRGRLTEVGVALVIGVLIDVLMSPFNGGPGGQGTGGALGSMLFARKQRKAARLVLYAATRNRPSS